MKLTILILGVLLVSTLHAAGSKKHAAMNAMIQIAKKANDAETAVMQVFQDLKATIEDERTKLTTKHKQRKAYFAKHLAELKNVKTVSCNTADSAVKHQTYIEGEISGTTEYLAWINQRYEEIDGLIGELKDARCTAAKNFVFRLKEHFEAQEAIAWLRNDIANWNAARGGSAFLQVDKLPAYNRLKAFTHLFQQSEINEFTQLASSAKLSKARKDPKNYMGDHLSVEKDRTKVGEHVDNTQGEQKLEKFSSGAQGRTGNIFQKIMTAIDNLEAALKKSLKDLQSGEVNAMFMTMRYVQKAEKETHFLQTEEETRTAYLAKLTNDLELAKDKVVETAAACKQAGVNLVLGKEDFENHKTWFMSEMDRLREDDAVINEIISIFKQELRGIDDIIRNQVGAYKIDESRFSKGIFRRVDANAE
jgi:hypothetical protein